MRILFDEDFDMRSHGNKQICEVVHVEEPHEFRQRSYGSEPDLGDVRSKMVGKKNRQTNEKKNNAEERRKNSMSTDVNILRTTRVY